MKTLRINISRVLTCLLIIAGVLAGLSALMATINALLRKIASFSFPWAEELCTYAIVVAVFLALPYLEWKGRQLSVDLLANSMKHKPKVLRGLQIFSSIVVLVLCCVIAWYGWISAMTAIETNITTFVLQWPRAIYFIIGVICFVIAAIACILSIIFDGTIDDNKKEEEHEEAEATLEITEENKSNEEGGVVS